MKLKVMPIEEFKAIMECNWTPVRLVGDALPTWMKNIPESVLAGTLASGTCSFPTKPYKSNQISSGKLIGGMDIYRNAPDDPVPFNKDWYAIVTHPEDSTVLLVDGPHKDAEHWLESISERCEGLKILGVPKKK